MTERIDQLIQSTTISIHYTNYTNYAHYTNYTTCNYTINVTTNDLMTKMILNLRFKVINQIYCNE